MKTAILIPIAAAALSASVRTQAPRDYSKIQRMGGGGR